MLLAKILPSSFVLPSLFLFPSYSDIFAIFCLISHQINKKQRCQTRRITIF
jgi:hypothetical protein